ncbi:putative bifunctional diguanylate cyclase/phosphodiesterase [Reinekea marinisedimentorum]|nr:GGDEF domain-containing phosphodiesterase [Reinekea marinisedimentorum]
MAQVNPVMQWQQSNGFSKITIILSVLLLSALAAISIAWHMAQRRTLKNLTRQLSHETELRKKAESSQAMRENLLAGAVFAYTSEGIVITDANANIIDANTSFERLTGYSKEEALGRNPNFLQSGQHDESFYKKMWAQLKASGYWRGEIWNRRKSGALYPELLTINSIRDEHNRVTNYIAIFSDISQLKMTEKRLDKLAYFDQVTDLPNRIHLTDRLDQAILHSQINNLQLAIIFLDLDRFKSINESFGHAAGDELLRQISKRLKATLRAVDTVARISSDEFVMLIQHISSREEVQTIVNKLMATFEIPFNIENRPYNQTASIGISVYPDDGSNTSELLRSADSAMYLAKNEGRNTFRFFDKSDIRLTEKRIRLEIALQRAAKKNEFSLAYQPQYELSSKRIIGLEALIRWHNPALGDIPPSQFIPVAEQNGKIREVGRWVLETACQQGADWARKGIDFGRISVNISGIQLHENNFDELVKKVLVKTGLQPSCLELEVTESVVMNRIDAGISQLNRLRKLGVKIAIDDFGTGYSSLEYLKKLPIDKLKLDRSFVKDIPGDQDDLAISRAVISMGKALGLEVVAEGIETIEQNSTLLESGCAFGQGYWFSKPQSAEQIYEFIRKAKSAS